MDALLLVTIVLGGAAALSWPLGRYLRWAMDPGSLAGPAARFDRVFRWCGGRLTHREQDWQQYCCALLWFNVVMFTIGFGEFAPCSSGCR
jgi:K+-transporting ATPase ATPase A chain